MQKWNPWKKTAKKKSPISVWRLRNTALTFAIPLRFIFFYFRKILHHDRERSWWKKIYGLGESFVHLAAVTSHVTLSETGSEPKIWSFWPFARTSYRGKKLLTLREAAHEKKMYGCVTFARLLRFAWFFLWERRTIMTFGLSKEFPKNIFAFKS